MTYVKQQWVDGQTKVDAQHLNHIEQGIADVESAIPDVSQFATKDDTYTKEQIDAKISSVMSYKGTVATVQDLPSSATVGDVYNVTDTGMNYAWNGSQWDALGSDIDLSNYVTNTELETELAKKQPAGDYATVEQLNTQLAEKQPVGDYATTQELNVGLATKQEVGDYPVYQKFSAGADPAERKTIQLANADSISGLSTSGGGANLIMLSKWDKVDIGSVNYQMNLNSPSGVVQINDEKVVATTDQIPDVSVFASKTELNDAIEAVEANIPDESQFVNIDVYNEDKAGLQTAIDGKQPVGDYPVYKQFVAGASDKQRKTIQLANADSISGIMSTGTGVNLAMVSEWDKADFGSSQLPLNLNATDGIVTINDSKTVATVDQIPDVSEFATVEFVNSKVASVMKYAGSVKTVSDLPSDSVNVGDVYNVEEDGSNYAWDGKQWDKLGGTIDLSNYATVEAMQSSLAGKADIVHTHNIADVNGLQTALDNKQGVGDYALKSEIPSVEGLASETFVAEAIAPISEQLETKQDKGDYALNSALEPLATKEAVASLKVVDLGTFDKVEGASYAAGADGVYNNKEAVVLTFDTAEGSGVIFNTMTATNSSAQRMYWNNQVLSRTVTDGSGTGWGILSNFTELQNRAIKSTLFTLTTDADSETIKAAMTNENSKTITASDLDSCLKYGYTIRDYALQSGSIFVGWTGSAYTLTYIGFASPTSEPYVMSVVVNVTPEGEYSIVRNGTRGQILTSTNLASNKTFKELSDGLAGKANAVHTHVIGDVTGLQDALDGKQDKGDYATNEVVQAEFESYDKTIKAYVDSKLTAVYTYKGSVANTQALPTENQTIGDVYNVEDTGKNVAWDGEKWDELGATVDLSAYAKTEDVNAQLASKANVEHTHEIADVDSLQDALDSKTVTVGHVGANVDTVQIKQGEQVIGQFEAPAHPVKVNASLFIDDGSFYDPDAGLGGHPDYFNNVAWSGGDSLSEEQLAQGPFLLITGTNTTASESEIAVLTNLVPLGKDSALGKFYANKEELAELANQLPVEIKLPVRTGIGGFQDKLYTQEEIFAWFGVTDLSGFLALAKSTRQVWISYVVGASFKTSAYRYLANYIEYMPKSKSITVIWVGPDSANADVISKFVFKANLDQTVISGASNVQLTVTSIE